MYKGGLLRCDECNGKVRVINSRLYNIQDELYRLRKYRCKNCAIEFNTTEKLIKVHLEENKK